MAWSTVSPAFGDRLTAAMVRQMGDNLLAVTQGAAGAPPLAVNSLMVTGVASMGQINLSQAAPGAPPANSLYAKNLCKCWVNFDGTTNPPTLRNGYNVAGVLDYGVGFYGVMMAVAISTSDYSVVGTVGSNLGVPAQVIEVSNVAYRSNSYFVLNTYTLSGTLVDANVIEAVVF